MEDFFDEEFYEIQNQISQIDPELVLIDEKWQKKKGEILQDLVLQIKLYGSKIIEDSKRQKYSVNRSTLRQQLSPFLNREKIFGWYNGRVDWKETVQILEEGFDSAENLMGSCEILQFLDYVVDIKSFLNIKLPTDKADFMSIAEIQQKVIHWLSISNRIKDKSVQLLLGNQQNDEVKNKSFFETVMLIEDEMVKKNTYYQTVEENQRMSIRASQMNTQINDLQEENAILQQEKLQYQQHNLKLNQDIEELLEEFATHKRKHEAICEEFQIIEGENNRFKLDIQNLNQQVNLLKEQNEFAEELEDIERLNSIIAEKDQQIIQIDLNLQILRGRLISLLTKEENKTAWSIKQNPEKLLEEIFTLINQFQFQLNSKESKSTQTTTEDSQIKFSYEFGANICQIYISANDLINTFKGEDKIKTLNNIQQILSQIDTLDQLQSTYFDQSPQVQKMSPLQSVQQNLIETIKMCQRAAQEELLITKKYENSELQNQRLKKILEEQQQTLDQRQKKQNEIEIQVKIVLKELDNLKSENKQLQKRNEDLEKELNLKDQNYTLMQNETNKHLTELKSQLSKKQNELKMLHQQNEILEQKIKELEEEKQMDQLNQRTCQIIQFEQIKSQIRDREVQLMSDKNYLKGELDRACQKIQELEGSLNQQINVKKKKKINNIKDKENLIYLSEGSQTSEVTLQKIIKNQEEEIRRLNDIVTISNFKKYPAQRERLK